MAEEKKIQKSEEELRKQLTPEQYKITQEKGTEPAFSGEYDKVFDEGTYNCVVCGSELFVSKNKYDSGCGWPAFDAPANEKNVDQKMDASHFMMRTEVTCQNCGAHLGHVFDDGPKETTGKRYCINSAALKLNKKE